MQMAFSNQIFLLDMYKFFREDLSENIQQRLADRLFDDDHVTILCKLQIFTKTNIRSTILGYGFKADASMLIASYPVFDRVVGTGKTLLDLSLVQTDVNELKTHLLYLIICFCF
jgi:hypothetical protein